VNIRTILLAALVSAGCYHPTFTSDIACGAAGECPPGTSCGNDSKCHASGSQTPDAATDVDAGVDAMPVACAANPDCATPPDLCSKPGTCDLGTHTCVFGAVDCSAMNDGCNHGVCQPATGSCVKMPANQDQACGAGTVLGNYGSCTATAGDCGGGMQFRSRTDNTCQTGICTAKNTTEAQSCSTDGVACGAAVITCDDTRCGGAPDMSCAGTEPCTETDHTCSAGACTVTTTKASPPRACTEPNGTTCSSIHTSCGGCTKATGAPTCSEAGHESCTDTSFSCSAGTCSGTPGTPYQGPTCSINTDGNTCFLKCLNGTEECTCTGGACTNCGPCQT